MKKTMDICKDIEENMPLNNRTVSIMFSKQLAENIFSNRIDEVMFHNIKNNVLKCNAWNNIYDDVVEKFYWNDLILETTTKSEPLCYRDTLLNYWYYIHDNNEIIMKLTTREMCHPQMFPSLLKYPFEDKYKKEIVSNSDMSVIFKTWGGVENGNEENIYEIYFQPKTDINLAFYLSLLDMDIEKYNLVKTFVES